MQKVALTAWWISNHNCKVIIIAAQRADFPSLLSRLLYFKYPQDPEQVHMHVCVFAGAPRELTYRMSSFRSVVLDDWFPHGSVKYAGDGRLESLLWNHNYCFWAPSSIVKQRVEESQLTVNVQRIVEHGLMRGKLETSISYRNVSTWALTVSQTMIHLLSL